MKIRVSLSKASIDEAIRKVEAYKKKVSYLGDEIAKRLAQLGYQTAYLVMNEHIYTGETIGSLSVEQQEEGKYILKAGSTALLFFEFGAGVNGGGHPLAKDFGYGPGTYPGQKHALDPNGWWYPTDDANLAIRTDEDGQMWAHSNGNPPRMPMYLASVEMREELLRVAKEVMQNN